MSRNKWKKLEIDTRKAADIEGLISNLAGQYDTGWTPDFENPDIGATIGKLYARTAEENLGRVNSILDRYHTEFVNMLDISLLPAKPANSIVVMELSSDTLQGTAVPKGTKLLTSGETPYVFETDHSLYVTGSRVDNAFMADREEGTIIPLLGSFSRATIPGTEPLSVNIEEFETFRLFGTGNNIEQNAVAFTHAVVFDSATEEVFVRIEGNKSVVSAIVKGEYEFFYASEENGLMPVDHVSLLPDGETFSLKKDTDESFTQLVLMAKKPPMATKKVERISFSSRGDAVNAEAVNSGANDLDVDKFQPFTDTFSMYAECYIGHDRYFRKAGARIELEFELYFEEHRITLNPLEEQEDLRIIKRKSAASRNELFADCYAQEVAIEYFNGTGWRKIPFTTDQRTLFSEGKARRIHLSFICPDDWDETSSGSYNGRAIRLQLLKSDNCYVRPAVHHYPIIKNLKLSYSYEDRYVDAQKAEVYFGTASEDITGQLQSEKGFTIFRRSIYEDDALYIGLSKKIENGPASILFRLEDGRRFASLGCHFEYYGYDGWRRMKVLDYTMDFSQTGVVMFMPPSDMKLETIEGHTSYFIRVVRKRRQSESEDTRTLPHIHDIVMNAVSVSNIETREEVPVYIDEAVPNMRFALGANNVLDAVVWVNETGRYSRDVMIRMEAENPDEVEINYDPQGQITSFYVRWKETDRLENSTDPRVYLLDRLQNELIFGDGIHTWIPRVLDDVALRFSVRCCNGQAGNVGVGEISEPMSNLNYIGTVTNPVRSYGGSNIETLENALARGAAILSSRNRLVSMDDFKRAILSYSDTIDQVAGIVGETVEGVKDPAEITFLLLMKEFAEGSFAFHRVVGGLKEEILKRSELTLVKDKLHIIEPLYVDISVSVWADVVSIDDSFEIQMLLRSCLEEYLNPVGYGTGTGWKIGTVPKKPQILMRLNVLKSRAIVKKSVMIASYSDASGDHEVDLGDLKVTPFMVPRSGEHQVHIIY